MTGLMDEIHIATPKQLQNFLQNIRVKFQDNSFLYHFPFVVVISTIVINSVLMGQDVKLCIPLLSNSTA